MLAALAARRSPPSPCPILPMRQTDIDAERKIKRSGERGRGGSGKDGEGRLGKGRRREERDVTWIDFTYRSGRDSEKGLVNELI